MSSEPQAPKQTKQKALPVCLQWTEEHLSRLEASFAEAQNEHLIRWAIPNVQGLGIPQPTRAMGDLDAFAGKLRGSLLTDGNKKLRPGIRSLAAHLLCHGPFALDLRILREAVIKAAIPEALMAVANAEINRLDKKEVA
jgi:hypothetical protein